MDAPTPCRVIDSKILSQRHNVYKHIHVDTHVLIQKHKGTHIHKHIHTLASYPGSWEEGKKEPGTHIHKHIHTLALYPGSWEEGKKEPGTHRSHMRLIPQTFLGSGYFFDTFDIR